MKIEPEPVAEPLPSIVQREPKAHIPLPGKTWSGEDEAEYHPPFQPTFLMYSYKDDLYKHIDAAIQYYNLNHQNDPFELVDPLLMNFFSPSDWEIGEICHLAFIAKSKKLSSKVKLFFAEISARRLVKICSVVDPGHPLVEIGCGACHPNGVIYHPSFEYDWSSGHKESSGGLSGIEKCAKRLFCEAYIIKSNIEDLDDEDASELKKMIYGHALKALEMYNSENDSSYEYLELVSCVRFACEAVSFGGSLWGHLEFVAEDKNRENSSVHFFAEACFDTDMAMPCVIIPTTHDVSLSENRRQCVVCPDVCPMFHPVGEYDAGYGGGIFIDSLCNGEFRGVKSELLMKDDEAARAARHAYYDHLESLGEW